MDTNRQEVSFEEGYQNLLILAGEPAGTDQFKVELQRILDRTQEALEFSMRPEEIEVIGLFLPRLRQIMENQEKFLLDLREKALIEMIPDEKPETESLN